MSDEKIVKLKPPNWYRRIIIQIADRPFQSFEEDGYTVYKKLEEAGQRALRQFEGHMPTLDFKAKVRLDPIELEWAFEHYNAELDRIVISKSLAKHIWLRKELEQPRFRLEVRFRSNTFTHEGREYRVDSRQHEIYMHEMQPIDFTHISDISPIAQPTKQKRFTRLQMGASTPFGRLDGIWDAVMALEPEIYKLQKTGALWSQDDQS